MANPNNSPFDEPRLIDSSDDVFKRYGYPALAGAILLLLVLSGGAYKWQQTMACEAAAQDKFSTAKSEDDYRSLIRQYPHTAAAALSLVEMAKTERENKNYGAAADLYGRFLKEHKGHPISPAVEYARAACLEGAGSKSDAKAAYEALFNAKPEHPYAGAAAVALARIYQADKNIVAARQVLTDLLARNTASSSLGEARELLRELPADTK